MITIVMKENTSTCLLVGVFESEAMALILLNCELEWKEDDPFGLNKERWLWLFLKEL